MFNFTAVSKSICSPLPREVLHWATSLEGDGHCSSSSSVFDGPSSITSLHCHRFGRAYPAIPPMQCRRWANVHLLPQVYTAWHALTSAAVHRTRASQKFFFPPPAGEKRES